MPVVNCPLTYVAQCVGENRRAMRLKTLFALPIGIILLVTLVLGGTLASQGWSNQSRGRAAVEAVEAMRLLLLLQADMRAERIATNFALGTPFPILDTVRARLAAARQKTDRRLATIVRRETVAQNGMLRPAPYLTTVAIRLGVARAAADRLLALPVADRGFNALNAMQPKMVWVSQALERPIERASTAVIHADPSLSGLLIEQRLATSLRDHVGLVAGVVIPRGNSGESLTDQDIERIRVLVAQAEYLVRLLDAAMEIGGATEPMRQAMAGLESRDDADMFNRLMRHTDAAGMRLRDRDDLMFPQHILVPWGEAVNLLRVAIVDAAVARVAARAANNERQFDIALLAFGVVLVAVLESIVLLSQRVVRPLAELGGAITRIAAGDRSVAPRFEPNAREFVDMATSVETLRQAALVADAAALRHRMAARQRVMALREALGIVETVRKPAHALERGVASLSAGIDATIALVRDRTKDPPPTLGAAADAVRVGLAAIRESSVELDSVCDAAAQAQTEDGPEAELVERIMAVHAEVDRHSAVVRSFVQPSLVALCDAASVTAAAPGSALRELVGVQFERIEEAVAMVAAMLSAVSRAAAIVHDLPLDEAA